MTDFSLALDEHRQHMRLKQLRRFWLGRLLEWQKRHGNVPDWLVREAAGPCEISPRSLRRWVALGKVPDARRPHAVIDEQVKELLVEYRNLATVAELLTAERGRGYSRRNLADRLRAELTEAEYRDLMGDDWRRGQLTLLHDPTETNARLHLDWTESSVFVTHPQTGEVIKPYIGSAVESGARGLAASIAVPGRPSGQDTQALLFRAFVCSERFPVSGLPAEIVWDNDPAHTANDVSTLLTDQLKIPVHLIDAYAPQQNGIAEAYNRTLDLRFSRAQLPYAHGTRQRNRELYAGESYALSWGLFLHKLDEECRWYRQEHRHKELDGRHTDEVWLESAGRTPFVGPPRVRGWWI